ncbi:putative F-box protein At1g60370 [Solanum stenotomum]|uniref:putative F-box protein At1g60370 n=1 Tax=Solanum stenotomum TaxID=172797 RepID=UPI0020D0C84A|nr:putative F-box protein At1g60370 [Solanum stenotomum]
MENKTSESGSRKYSIPEEIMCDIFSRLPVDSLMRFKCLSKFYNSLISDPSFIDIHESHSIFRPHKIKILARSKDENIFYTVEQQAEHKKPIVIEEFDGTICHNFHYVNGLFCLWSTKELPPAIYNPITGIAEYLPSPSFINDDLTHNYYSFGFEPNEKKFKILMSSDPQINGSRHWVLTLGSSESWREIKSAPCSLLQLTGGEICIKGVIYFVGIHNKRRCIVAFNIRMENFRIISLWDVFDFFMPRKFYHDLVEVEGKLAIIDRSRCNMGEMDLMVLQSCETEEWVKHIIIFSDALCSSLKTLDFFCSSTPDGEIVCIFDRRNLIIFYDLKEKSWREIKIKELADKLEIVGIYSQANNLLPCIYC